MAKPKLNSSTDDSAVMSSDASNFGANTNFLMISNPLAIPAAPLAGDPANPMPVLTTALATAAPLAGPLDPKLCPRQITFTIPAAPGGVSVTVTATEDGAGNLDFAANTNSTATLTGDLGGL